MTSCIRSPRFESSRVACAVVAIAGSLLASAPLVAQVSADRPALTAGEIARSASGSVVTITTPTGTGSGVIVDASGTLVTNLHVVRGANTVSVRLANGDVYDDAQVVDVDERKDLAVLRIKAFGLKPATFGNSDEVSVGDTVYVLGSPRGLQNTLSNGLVSAIRAKGTG